MGKITFFSPGRSGVSIDASPLTPGVPLDTLSTAQNATHDPIAAHGGALRKRPGLARFNSVGAGGIILGGLMLPVAETGGAPAAGGGAIIGTGDSADGTSTGTGNMTGAPGGTFDGGAATVPAAGSATFGGGSLFSGKRLLAIARIDGTNANSGGSGWYVTSKSIADTAVSTTTPGPPVAVYGFPPQAPFTLAYGIPGCVSTDGKKLYYAGWHSSQIVSAADFAAQSQRATIRQTDGGTDAVLGTIPYNGNAAAGITGTLGVWGFTPLPRAGTTYQTGDILTLTGGTFATAATMAYGQGMTNVGDYTVLPVAGTNTVSGGHGVGVGDFTGLIPGTTPQRTGIVSLHYGSDGYIYVCVKDKYTGQTAAGSAGRVFRLTPSTGALVEWNVAKDTTIASGASPNLLNRVPYCSCFFDSKLYVGTYPDATDESAVVVATDGLAAVGETAFGTGAGRAYGLLSCMATYNGRLFLGTGVWHATPDFAMLWSRRPGDLIQNSISAWATQASFTASGGVASTGNFFSSMVVFNGALYAAWYGADVTNAKIYKIVADNIGDATSTSFTVTVATSSISKTQPYHLVVDDGVLYAMGINDGGAISFFSTTDGATWTDRAANIPTFGNSSRPRAVLFGMTQ